MRFKKFKRWLCVLLTVCMVATGTIPISADMQGKGIVSGEGNSEEKPNTETSEEDLQQEDTNTTENEASEGSSSEETQNQQNNDTEATDPAINGGEASENREEQDETTDNPTEDPVTEQDLKDETKVSYQAHVSGIGWQAAVTEGENAGTTGQSKAIEALKVTTGIEGLGVNYRAQVAQIGWQGYVSDGQTAGTTGQSKAMETICLELSGDKAGEYDIYYRVHSAKAGWLGWASNGNPAGTEGYGRAIEAIQILILEKGSEDAPQIGGAYKANLVIYSTAHVSEKGWQSSVSNGEISGTVGQSNSIEALILSTNHMHGIGIRSQAHVSGIGWQEFVGEGAITGTTGQSRGVEALRMELTGDNAEEYDLYYRVHVAHVGWLDWAKNGEAAGSQGLSCGIEAVQITTVLKGEAAPGSVKGPFLKGDIKYQAHVQKIGWQGNSSNGSVAGTEGQNLELEALRINTEEMSGVGVKYSAHVGNVGWQTFVSNGDLSGTTGQSRAIQAMKIELTGENSGRYDVWYRMHVEKLGWLGWTKNGSIAGTTGIGYNAQAIQIKIQAKGAPAPGATANSYVDRIAGWVYVDGFRRYKTENGTILNDVSGIFNPSSKKITVDRRRGITTIYGYNPETGSYDTPIKSMLCSVGNPISLTSAGTYRIGWQLLKKEMNASDGSYRCWAPYVSQIYGLVYFHGVSSSTPDLRTISAVDFNNLGNPMSHGCVRLAACDARWIYYNAKSGDTVVIGDNMAAPMSPKRYAWAGGAYGADPTY